MEQPHFEHFDQLYELSLKQVQEMDELFRDIIPLHKHVTRSQDIELYKVGSVKGYTDAQIKDYKQLKGIIIDHPIEEGISNERIIPPAANDDEY